MTILPHCRISGSVLHPRIPFHSVHVLSTDSHGNPYTGEMGAAPSVQKFVAVSGVPAR